MISDIKFKTDHNMVFLEYKNYLYSDEIHDVNGYVHYIQNFLNRLPSCSMVQPSSEVKFYINCDYRTVRIYIQCFNNMEAIYLRNILNDFIATGEEDFNFITQIELFTQDYEKARSWCVDNFTSWVTSVINNPELYNYQKADTFTNLRFGFGPFMSSIEPELPCIYLFGFKSEDDKLLFELKWK